MRRDNHVSTLEFFFLSASCQLEQPNYKFLLFWFFDADPVQAAVFVHKSQVRLG